RGGARRPRRRDRRRRAAGGAGRRRQPRLEARADRPLRRARALREAADLTGRSLEDVRSLLEAPSPAVLTTTRKDGRPYASPVWFRWTGEAFEVVIARGDVKLRHLARDPRCSLLVFEAV